MKWLILFLLLPFSIVYADNISKTNELKKEAEIAYKKKDYVKAAGIYSDLFNKYKIKDDNAGLNYAHSLLLAGEAEAAEKQYKNLIASTDKQVKSIANQQLGNTAAKNNNYKEALDYYKEALKADPENEDARFNVELMKKKLKENPPQQDDKQNQDKKEQDKQDKQDQQNKQDQNKGDGDKEDKNNQDNKGDKGDKNKDDKGKDGKGGKDKKDEDSKDKKGDKGDKSDKKEDKDKEGKDQQSKGDKKDDKGNKEKETEEGKDGKDPKKEEGKQDPNGNSQGRPLENMQISQEKAKMLLDAMRNAEKQYLQQLKKEPTKRKDKGKPDW